MIRSRGRRARLAGEEEIHRWLPRARRGTTATLSPEISVIVPTLNEEKHLGKLLSSVAAQSYPPLEVVVVDGGSSDATAQVARAWGARTVFAPGAPEFPSRNLGARHARGTILLFTGADVFLPSRVLEAIRDRFDDDPAIAAVAGPGVPIDPPWLLGVEYALYNCLRYVIAHLPPPVKRYTTSTNILAVRSTVFAKLGGFEDDVNADGKFGAKVSACAKTVFCYREVRAYISSRRLEKMGFLEFNKHFLYVLENFFPPASQWRSVRRRKEISALQHGDLHLVPQSAGSAASVDAADDGAATVDLSEDAVAEMPGR